MGEYSELISLWANSIFDIQGQVLGWGWGAVLFTLLAFTVV